MLDSDLNFYCATPYISDYAYVVKIVVVLNLLKMIGTWKFTLKPIKKF